MISPADISATGISSYFANNGWAFRAFGGLSLNILVLRVDVTGLYITLAMAATAAVWECGSNCNRVSFQVAAEGYRGYLKSAVCAEYPKQLTPEKMIIQLLRRF
jgi:hypothetical protein